jgi:hypothetical protein
VPKLLTVEEVYAKHRAILKVIQKYELDNSLPTYTELLNESEQSDSTFYRSVVLLEKGGFIKKITLRGQTYYVMKKWGELLLELEVRKDFWTNITFLGMMYLTDGPKVNLDG